MKTGSGINEVLKALAQDELNALKSTAQLGSEVHRLYVLQSELRSLVILNTDIDVPRKTLFRFLSDWRRITHSPITFANLINLDEDVPQSSEQALLASDVVQGGIQSAIAANDTELVRNFAFRFSEHQPPRPLSLTSVLLQGHYLCLLSNGRFEEAENDVSRLWPEWVDDELVYEQDPLWLGIRAISLGDPDMLAQTLKTSAQNRELVVSAAITRSPSMLRSTLPVHLFLQTSAVALVRLAHQRGLYTRLSQDWIDPRLAQLWNLQERADI